MQELPQNRFDSIRGDLAASPLGARGLLRVAGNADCVRLQAMSRAGVSPALVAREIYGIEPREGQSPFAIGAGNQFERLILANQAERLRAAYADQGLALPDPAAIAFIEELCPGKGPAVSAERERQTLAFLAARAAGRASPDLIVKPKLRVNLLGGEHWIEPDALVALPDVRSYLPVEMKSYPDRGGKTAKSDIASACLQAAVGWIALEQAMAALSLPPKLIGYPACHLVLRKPGLYYPTIRPMTIAGEVDLVRRKLGSAGPSQVEAVLDALGREIRLDRRADVDALPIAFSEGCKTSCALAEVCKAQAIRDGDLMVLGAAVRDSARAAATLNRAIELMLGSGAPPADQDEWVLAERMRLAMGMYGEALADDV